MLAVLIAVPSAASGADEGAFPLTITDDEGTEVTIEALPQRIVSLSPANTEIVFTLGAGDRLMGGTDFDDFPAEAVPLPDVATFDDVIMEQLVALEPDLVLAAGSGFNPPDDIARLRELGIPVVVLYAESVDEVLADIGIIGQAVGEVEAAQTIIAGMTARIEEVASATAAMGTTPRTFYEVSSIPALSGPADDSFVEHMIRLAGGEPVTTGSALDWVMPLERLVAADPEVIVVGDANYGVCPAEVAARPGWSGIAAVREGAVRPIDDIPVTRPGPRLADGLASLALAIHPDLDLVDPPAGFAGCPAA
jgi:iron complex transport system substrate-binding protein